MRDTGRPKLGIGRRILSEVPFVGMVVCVKGMFQASDHP